eukprot:scaffold319734_cov78-Attheya_sp.AAC.1
MNAIELFSTNGSKLTPDVGTGQELLPILSCRDDTAQHHPNQNHQPQQPPHEHDAPIPPPRVRWSSPNVQNDDSFASIFSQCPPQGISREPTHYQQQHSMDSTPPGRRPSQFNNSNYSIGSEEGQIMGLRNSPPFRMTASILESLDGFEDEPSDEGCLYSNNTPPPAASRNVDPSPSSSSRISPNVTRVVPSNVWDDSTKIPIDTQLLANDVGDTCKVIRPSFIVVDPGWQSSIIVLHHLSLSFRPNPKVYGQHHMPPTVRVDLLVSHQYHVVVVMMTARRMEPHIGKIGANR